MRVWLIAIALAMSGCTVFPAHAYDCVTVSLAASPETAAPGENISFTLDVTNCAARDVALKDVGCGPEYWAPATLGPGGVPYLLEESVRAGINASTVPGGSATDVQLCDATVRLDGPSFSPGLHREVWRWNGTFETCHPEPCSIAPAAPREYRFSTTVETIGPPSIAHVANATVRRVGS